MEDALAAAWRVHARLHVEMLEAVPEEALEATLPKGKSVRALFVHTHNVRRSWLEPAAPALAAKLVKLDGKTGIGKVELAAALKASGEAVAKLFATAAGGKIKNVSLAPATFLAYLISHESHHRGQIGYTLKHGGFPLSKEAAYGLWNWK